MTLREQAKVAIPHRRFASARSSRAIVARCGRYLPDSIRLIVSGRTPASAANCFCPNPASVLRRINDRAITALIASFAGRSPR